MTATKDEGTKGFALRAKCQVPWRGEGRVVTRFRDGDYPVGRGGKHATYTVSTSVALIAGVLVTIWAVPAVSDADSEWVDADSVRGRNVDVEQIAPGSVPSGVKPPAEELLAGA